MHAADKEHLLELAETAKTLIAGTCTVVNTEGTIPKPTETGACYTLTFPTVNPATTDFHATVDTTGVANVAFFGEHGPTEFERDTHYFMDNGMSVADMASATAGNTVASGGPVEPGEDGKAQTDAEEYNCRFLKNGDVKTCAQAFLVIQSHHDYCDHDTLTPYEEKLFHDWEGKCHGCSIVRKYDPALNDCPRVDCLDTTVAELGYEVLNETCVAADTALAFEWAGSFDTPAASYTWVSQAATKVNPNDVFPANHSYKDAEMKVVAFKMTSTLKSAMWPKRDKADEIMSTGSCPEVTASCTPGDVSCASKPTITPTTAGACVTVKFPTDASKDFHATVDTDGVAHVAFFTAHVPIEFERDTHYFMSTDLATDIEAEHELGASAGHDHGRRLLEVSRNDRRSRRRLASPGMCCYTGKQQGAWKQVVSYHDQCAHDQVPEYIEKGFHDYEASCAGEHKDDDDPTIAAKNAKKDFFCNLIGPDEDQLKCPYSPPTPPPPPSLPPTVVTKTESTGIEEGTLIGVIVAAVVVAVILLAGVCCLVAKEKAGKPLFTNLDVKPDP